MHVFAWRRSHVAVANNFLSDVLTRFSDDLLERGLVYKFVHLQQRLFLLDCLLLYDLWLFIGPTHRTIRVFVALRFFFRRTTRHARL